MQMADINGIFRMECGKYVDDCILGIRMVMLGCASEMGVHHRDASDNMCMTEETDT